ncbi:hypothetical protein ACFYO1_08210 [Nocardia sp. NPDC006044]|uniref:hypothetical protein n=1 Tax=Nocardia sp. NPDC006044 TaxID=3364306 RepID=UPI0036B8EEB2
MDGIPGPEDQPDEGLDVPVDVSAGFRAVLGVQVQDSSSPFSTRTSATRYPGKCARTESASHSF